MGATPNIEYEIFLAENQDYGMWTEYKKDDFNQNLTKPKRGKRSWNSIDDVLDKIDSITLSFYDAMNVMDLMALHGYSLITNHGAEMQYLAEEDSLALYRILWLKSNHRSLNKNELTKRIAEMNNWSEMECGQFQEVCFLYDETDEKLLATITQHNNGVVSLKIDGLKQYNTIRSVKKREYLGRMLLRFHNSKGILRRLHLAFDTKSYLGDTPILRDSGKWVVYNKQTRNNLEFEVMRIERTLNKMETEFNNVPDMLNKIMKSWFRHFKY